MEWELAWYPNEKEAHLSFWDSLHGQDRDITIRGSEAFLSERDDQDKERLVPIDLPSYLFDLIEAANA